LQRLSLAFVVVAVALVLGGVLLADRAMVTYGVITLFVFPVVIGTLWPAYRDLPR
jgi:hypothetical protein